MYAGRPSALSVCECVIDTYILYSQKIWRGIKFGGLAVYITTAKLKSANILAIEGLHTGFFSGGGGGGGGGGISQMIYFVCVYMRHCHAYTSN